MPTQSVSQFELFIKNIATGFDRFFKPYDLLYSLKNTHHVTVEVPLRSKDSILEYYTRVFLRENEKSLTGNILLVQPKNFKVDADLPTAKTIIFDKKNPAQVLKQIKSLKAKSWNLIVFADVLTNVLDYQAVLEASYKALAENGSIIATAHTISTPNLDNLWGFTASGIKYLFSKVFEQNTITVRSYGNALVGRFFLEKKKAADLTLEELNYSDLYFPVVVAAIAAK